MSEDYSDIKNYSFEKDIGEGNFGKVKLGIFKPTREEFAIKVLNKDKIKIKMKNSIFKENEIITKFNHINVIYVFQILEDEENFYIIMEYCKHGELFDYIVKNEVLSEEEASIFFYQLINGIEYIHSKGIAHRDLKPENLLLDENNILKIIDFGLSHEFSGGDELLKTKCGSPSYAAPEIICCPSYDGFKVDVWCCGIILYAMVCGYLPFDGDNNDILFKNILNCDPELPEFLSDECVDIILKILTPDPERRITFEEIKKHSFYLMGKRLCNIDYDAIENRIIKKRDILFNNSDKKNKDIIISEPNKKFNSKNNNDNEIDTHIKYYNTINNNIDREKKIIIGNNENNINNLNIIKNSNSLDGFKKTIMDVNLKYNKKTFDSVTEKIKHILKTETNSNNNNNIKTNINKNVVTTSNNVNNKKLKPFNFIDFIIDNKSKKYKKDSLLIKILDSTKNNFLSFYKDNEKLSHNKYNTNRTTKNKIDILNQTKHSFNKNVSKNKNKGNIVNKNENKKKEIYNKYINSLSKDNINTNSKNNKKRYKYNLFKETLKNKNKGKHRFNIMKALSLYDKKEKTIKSVNTPHLSKKNSGHINNSSNNSSKINKNREINFIVPHHTLYYNNINININELNINNHKIKSSSKNRKNQINNYNVSSFDNNKKNKTISAKRLFSYNLKNNKTIKINTNTINSNQNIYTINNNSNNRNYIINTINNFENKNNNIKLSSKPRRILSTEPKEILKLQKQFSFDKRDISNKQKKKYRNDIKREKRSKSEKADKFNKNKIEGNKNAISNHKSISKNLKNKKNIFKCDINKLDELFLHMFMEQKYNKKKK